MVISNITQRSAAGRKNMNEKPQDEITRPLDKIVMPRYSLRTKGPYSVYWHWQGVSNNIRTLMIIAKHIAKKSWCIEDHKTGMLYVKKEYTEEPLVKMGENRPGQGCSWTADEEGSWSTECGQLHCIIEGTPSENGMGFCCYCVKELHEIPFKWANDYEPERSEYHPEDCMVMGRKEKGIAAHGCQYKEVGE